ncbi:hypothetical protein PILCRDRAFT_819832 [Piloderma croceum F 1598]|uniref:Uncharacterized protein n=1 Tax=Piloderma croceum (strain F 1598) TaxID=765440 RepID=A0A0C3C0B5_PILCF|nr:hypothetical protein PILCRDRAFT_819832 [Piloderma croceum F 1598]
MDRPVTSKARGACRYYMTPRGCFAGDSCKFLHGQEQLLTPYDQSKPCRFYAKGYCRRGDECWFRHNIIPESSTSQQKDEVSDSSAADDVCNICLEKPTTYGLLIGCGHVFCIKCIRQWRDPAGKSGEMSDVIKKCPLCRASSRYITPSSISFPHNHPGKSEAIDKYKASMARVPCRYFQLSKPSKRFCPFGKDCFYQHLNDDGTAYIFPHGTDHYMKLYKFRQNRDGGMSGNVAYDAAAAALNPLNLFSRLLSNNQLDDLNATMETLRVNLPAFLDQWGPGERDEEYVTDDEEGEEEVERYRNLINRGNNGGNGHYGDTDHVDTLERLADRMLESLVALRDNVHHSPARPLRSNGNITRPLEGDYDDLPALEPVESGSSSSSSLSPRETPSPPPVPSILSLSQPLSATTAATSRFSTVVGNRSQEQVFIDLVSEDEDENEDDEDDEGAPSEVVEQALVGESSGMRSEDVEREVAGRFGEDREMIWLDNDFVPDNSQAAHTVGRRAGQLTTDINDSTELSLVENEPDQPAHDAEPPFVTDGRGRVVWSSMRPGRAVQAEAVHESPMPSHLTYTGTTGIATRIKTRRAGRESNSTVGTTASNGFTTDGRGRVIGTGSPDALADEHRNEELAAPGVDTENDVVQAAEPSQNGSRRSFFGRVYDVVFS